MSESEKEKNFEATRDQVQNWLMSEGWQIAEPTHPDFAWLIRAEDAAGRENVNREAIVSNHSDCLRNFLVGRTKEDYNPYDPKDSQLHIRVRQAPIKTVFGSVLYA